jgi:AcrR family transcriptional regulator
MAQQVRAQITRERLIDGAAEAFTRLGYISATTSDIARAAGATRGALYFHFQSKEEIARAVVDKEQRLAVESGTRIVEMGRPALETMLLLSADLAERMQVDPVVKAGIRLTTENSNFDPPLRAPYEQWLATFGAIAAVAVEQGDFRHDLDPAMFARFLIPSYTGIQLVSDTFTGRADLLPRIREMWLFMFPAVVPAERMRHALDLLDGVLPA